jgi:hypothetical protein
VALKELEKRLEQEPENLGLRVMVAGALREAGRHDEATALYVSVARIYRDQGRFQQAIAVCRSALEQAPTEPRLRELLAALTTLPLTAPAPAPPSAGPLPPRVVAKPSLAERSIEPHSHPTVRRAAPTERSSSETPLPRPMPYHVYDPTSGAQKISLSELPTVEGADTRPGSEPEVRQSVEGLASAARRITRTLTGDADVDVAAELETRERPRVEPEDAVRLSEPPPTLPTERILLDEVDEDATTPVPLDPRESEEELTNPRDLVMAPRRPIDSQLLAPLPVERRGTVLARFYKRTVKKSDTVIRQGETGHPLVLVVSGRLEVRAERANGGIAMLEALGELDAIGESSLLARAPAEANVVAMSDAELLLLSPHDVFEIAGAFPAWWAYLKQIAERRTRDHERRR